MRPAPFNDGVLDAGIRAFQRENGLTETGEVKAGDETQQVLKAEAAKALEIKSSRGRFNLDAVTKSANAREDEVERGVDGAPANAGERVADPQKRFEQFRHLIYHHADHNS